MNVLANCQKHFLVDTKNPTKVAKDNLHGYVVNPKWSDFLKDWAHLLDSPTAAEYTSRLVKFRAHPKEAVAYIEDTWLVWKEKLVLCWVDKCMHFGVRVTSPIEGCHAVLKAYLRVSTGDLKGVFDRLLPYWPTQHRAIVDARATEQVKMMHRLKKRYFDLVQHLVYNKALLLIMHERVKLYKKRGFVLKEVPVRWSNDPRTKVDPVLDSINQFFDLLRVRWYDMRGEYRDVPMKAPVTAIPALQDHSLC